MWAKWNIFIQLWVTSNSFIHFWGTSNSFFNFRELQTASFQFKYYTTTSFNPLTTAIGRHFFGHKSPATRARDLFKPYMYSTSLLVDIEKNVFRFRWGFSGGDVTMKACFGNFGHLGRSWTPTNWPILLAQSFVEI